MKKKGMVLMAAALSVMLTACQGGTAEKTAKTETEAKIEAGGQKETKETESREELPASQEYISADGAYSVTLVEGLTQNDVQFQPNSSMMGLDSAKDRTGFSAFAIGCLKEGVPGNPEKMESLEDYADHVVKLTLSGSGLSVDWKEAEAPSEEGMVRSIAREGTATIGAARGQAYARYLESEDSYYAVMVVGNSKDVEDAKKVLSLKVGEGVSAENRGTKDFLTAMTAVLDKVNGASVLETCKALEDMGGDNGQMKSQARQSLLSSWEITDKDSLYEMADWLMEEGHNQNALEYLKEYKGTDGISRDELTEKIKAAGGTQEEQAALLNAYDAWSAYGDAAISAWDLSRVGTIMGFGYAAGYCTYEEALDKMLEAAVKAQQSFDSWESFNQSYLYGYAYWMEESLEDAQSSAAERAEIVEGLKAQANGPFATDWNMELKKEW